jgi:hypothetical protein
MFKHRTRPAHSKIGHHAAGARRLVGSNGRQVVLDNSDRKIPDHPSLPNENRRTFVVAGISAVAATITAVTPYFDQMGQRKKENTKRLQEPVFDLSFTPDRQALSRIFPFLFNNRYSISYCPSDDNRAMAKLQLIQGRPTLAEALEKRHNLSTESISISQGASGIYSISNPLNIYTLTTLAEAELARTAFNLGITTPSWKSLEEQGQWGLHGRKCNVVIGSPVANSIAAELRGKIRKSDTIDQFEHLGVHGLNLPFEFQLDASKAKDILDEQGLSSKRFIYKTRHYNAEIAEEFRQGKYALDYLIISVVPNHVSGNLAARDPNRRILLIEGCTGVGTSAAHIIWSSPGLLKSVIKRLNRLRSPIYWQALFAVTRATKPIDVSFLLPDAKSPRVATAVELVDVAPVTVDPIRLQEHIRRSQAWIQTAARTLTSGGQ